MKHETNGLTWRLTRRQFIEWNCLTGLLIWLPGCSANRSGLYESNSWGRNLVQGYTPGICYSVMPKSEAVATAKGVVARLYDLPERAHRTGGLMLTIAHPNLEETIYYTHHAHLSKSYVIVGQNVERGQPLAIPGHAYSSNTKFMFQEKFGANWINPNQYGINHGPMQFYDGISNFDVENLGEKLKKQKQIIIDMQVAYNGPKKEFVDNMDLEMHRSYGNNLCRWSDVDKINYIKILHASNPSDYKMSKKNFDELISEFYSNQAITLTLPFLQTDKSIT